MIERINLLSLRELASEYQIPLMDTSVLYRELSENVKAYSREKKLISIGNQEKFFGVLRDYVEQKVPFFITPLVSEEYIGGNFPYKKFIKKKGVQQNRESLDLARRIRDSRREGRRMIDFLREKGRIIELSETEKEDYNSFCNSYYGHACRELGEVDSDFLIEGAVLSKMRGTTCLVTNDFGMLPIWKHFLNDNWIRKEQFGLAVRLGMNSFKILDN